MIDNIKNPKDLEIIGIGILNIKDAASLITKCLYCEGEINLGDKEYEISLFSKELEEVLKTHTEKFINILIKAIDDKTLIPRAVRRNLDGTLVIEETYINNTDLVEWLEERNIHLGDFYYDSYLDFESDLYIKAEECVRNAINIKKYPDDYKEFQEKTVLNPDTIFSDYVEQRYKIFNSQETTTKEKPLHKKEQDSLLKLFMGMLVSNYGLDNILSGDVKASEISKDIRLNSGIDMDDDTIRKYLKKGLEILEKYK